MRIASMCAVSALALGFIHSPALAQNPQPVPLPTASEREEVRTTYIFKFDDSVPRGEMVDRARQAVAGTGGQLRHVYTEVLGGFAATLPSTAVWNVARRPGIASFEQDQFATIFGLCDANPGHPKCSDTGGGEDPGDGDPVPPPPAGDLACTGGYIDTKPWGIGRIGAPAAHANVDPNCGQGIHVYVLDTGIDLDHPDLTPVAGVDCTSGCVSGGEDKNGHGTHVAGTIAARINNSQVVGVAPAVHLHAVQVLGPSGRGSFSDIIAGVQHVAKQAQIVETDGSSRGPVVANMSLGGTGGKSGTCHGTKQGEDSDGPIYFVGTDSLHEAMCDAAHVGVVFVVAAGNSDADAEGFVPAAYDDTVITVTATDNKDDWPYWSNWGNGTKLADGALVDAPAPAPVTIAAPGASILSTEKDGGTSTKSGTSMASPHVAGVAALLLRAYTGTSDYAAFVKIRDDILLTAEPTKGENTTFNPGSNPHDENFACADADAVNGCPRPTQ